MAGILQGGEMGGDAGAFVGDGELERGDGRMDNGLDGVAVDDDLSFAGVGVGMDGGHRLCLVNVDVKCSRRLHMPIR